MQASFGEFLCFCAACVTKKRVKKCYNFFSERGQQTNQTDRLASRTYKLSMATKKKNVVDARGDERSRTKMYNAAEAGDVAEVARLLELKVDFEQVLAEGSERATLSSGF